MRKSLAILLRASEEFFLGGQAVIEGVVIRSRSKVALAVRRADGSIGVKSWSVKPYREINPILGFPIIRGVMALYDALVWGIKTLCYSADEALGGKEKLSLLEVVGSVALALGLAIGLFVILPASIAHIVEVKEGLGRISLNIVEGIFRVLTFLLYLLFIGLFKEIRRIFSYHGAEHKVINAYESLRSTVNPEDVRSYSRFHYRCGTSFILFVLVISIVCFAVFEQETLIRRFLVRVSLIPLIAGISYEILKMTSSSAIGHLLAKPGIWLQYLTTREPTLDQIEVGIAALKEALGDVGETKENRGRV